MANRFSSSFTVYPKVFTIFVCPQTVRKILQRKGSLDMNHETWGDFFDELFLQQLLQSLRKTPATPTRVDPTPTHPEIMGTGVTAPARPAWLASLPTAGQSVSSTQTVRTTRRAGTRSVLTLVQVSVVAMQTVGSGITSPCVSVTQASLETHSLAVTDQQVSFTNLPNSLLSYELFL